MKILTRMNENEQTPSNGYFIKGTTVYYKYCTIRFNMIEFEMIKDLENSNTINIIEELLDYSDMSQSEIKTYLDDLFNEYKYQSNSYYNHVIEKKISNLVKELLEFKFSPENIKQLKMFSDDVYEKLSKLSKSKRYRKNVKEFFNKLNLYRIEQFNYENLLTGIDSF